MVALNSGTTNTVLAQEMSGFNLKFTVVTNNYAALSILMQNPAIRLIAVGGTVDPTGTLHLWKRVRTGVCRVPP